MYAKLRFIIAMLFSGDVVLLFTILRPEKSS